MDDVELQRLDHEIDLIADPFPMSRAFWSGCLYDFKQLPKGTSPDLTEEQVPALFERWARRYEARDQEQERARSVRTLRLWYERGRLMAQMKFLPDGPERWKAALGIGEQGCRSLCAEGPQPLPAKWAADEGR